MRKFQPIYAFLSGSAKTASIIFALILSLSAQKVFAEANYVYHEATTNNPGCGVDNYRSVLTPNSSQSLTVTWKSEFQFYTDNLRLYYTTDGSTPSGAFGIPSGTTQVITGSYSCLFGSTDIAIATIPPQPAGTVVNYILSAWHSGGGSEIFANGPGAPCACGTPTNNSSLATVFNYTVTASASVVEVYATGGTTYAAYTTLKGAFDAINLGTHTGVLRIAINSSTTETATASLNASGGAVNYTSVKIFPTSISTVTGSILGAIIKLNGADNVTMDGRIGGTGNNLTVSNSSTSSATVAIWVSSVGVGAGATNNVIRNLNISCGVDQSTSTSASYGIILSGTSISSTSNSEDSDNNQFLFNNITKCRYGILTRGSTTNLNSGIVISNNIIGPSAFGSNEIGKAGIFMQGETGAIVNGNTIQYVGGPYANTSGGTDRMGIAIGTESWSMAPGTYTSNSYTITNNIIHDIVEERTFSAVGINLGTTGGGSATNNIVANNFIYNVKSNGTAGDNCAGIGIAGGHTDKVVYNTIYMSGDVDPNPSASATSNHGSGIRVANINGTTHLNLTLKNNIVYMDLSSSSAPTVRYYAISGNISSYSFGTGGENNNAYYINPSNPQLMTGGLGSASGVALTNQFATLALWQAAYTAPQDANSIASLPTFTSSTDLHMQATGGNAPFNNSGTPIAGVTTDYDGETRDAITPDMGADEFSIPTCAGAVGGTISPSTASACAGLTYNMSTTGSTAAAGITYQWEVSTTGGGIGFSNVSGGSGANTISYTTGALTAGTYYYRLNVTCETGPVTDYSNELTLTVNPTPTASASSNSPVCEGTAINLYGTTDIGTTFTWTGPLAYTSASEDPTIASAILTNGGTYIFTASAGGCSSAPANTVVVVNPNPTGVTANAAPPSLCEGTAITLTSSNNPVGYVVNPAGTELFIDISGTGVSVGTLGDDFEYNITMPAFNFNGVIYTSARVGNNGAIALGSSTGEIANGNAALPSTANSAGNVLLLPWWDDLDIDFTGEVISTETVGSKFIIQYSNMSHFSYASGGVTFQIQLDIVSGAIHFVYSDVIFGSATYDSGLTATVGIQFSSSSAMQYSLNTASLTNGQCISYTPASTSYSWSGPDAFSAATQNTSVASATLASAGIYIVTVTNDLTGCSTSASTASVTVDPNVTYYADTDTDTYGDAGTTTLSCTGAPVGYVSDNTDCNDGDATINPGATEICANGTDDNCDGSIDEGCTLYTFYLDSDSDTYGDAAVFVTNFTGIAPGGYVADATDCDDSNAAINPGATEICNGTDEDCDGINDDGLTFVDYYIDNDADGYGDAFASPVNSCSAVVGSVTNNTDCNDSNNTVNPAGTEICNGVDDNCDGTVDDGIIYAYSYFDADLDGYGDPLVVISTCDGPPSGYVLNNTDCDDGNAAVNPGATEICNGIDDDCTGGVDDGLIFTDYYTDGDSDGYGDASASPVSSCSAVAGSVTNNTDCNDGNAAINPSATEICNFIDDDCDGTPDDGISYLVYYTDADLDGFGAGIGSNYCSDPGAGFSTLDNDCDDGSAGVNPAATEICNGIDDDCNGTPDDGLIFTTYYADVDSDTYGDAFNTTSTCDGLPSGYVTDATDCDDTQNTVYPGATEVCDGLDNDCDGDYDEGTVTATVSPSGTVLTCKGTPAVLTANAGVGYTYQWFKNGNLILGATSINFGATKPGYYQVQVNIPDGCFALSAATTVNILPAPNATISAPNGTSLCAVVKLKLNYNAENSYQWYKDDALIPAATNYLYLATTPGDYYCIVTNTTTGCSRTSPTLTVTACKEGEIAETPAETMDIYPNPAMNEFTIELATGSAEDVATIQIYNIMGELVYTATASVDAGVITENIVLDEKIPGGMYVIKVILGQKEFTRQLVIQK